MKRKKIIIITLGEIIPLIGDQGKEMRSSKIAKEFAKRNFEVLYITNLFDHFKKKFRKKNYFHKNNLKIKAISTIGYDNNISIKRYIDHIQFSIKLFFLLINEKPDIILCSYPSIENCLVSKFASKILSSSIYFDVRDIWPDTTKIKKTNIFLKIFNVYYRFLFNLISKSFFFTISNQYKKWLISKKVRKKNIKIFELGSERLKLKKNYNSKSNFISLWFLGSLGESYNLKDMIEVTRNNKKISLVVSGEGKNLTKYKYLSKSCNRIIFTGWIGYKKILKLAKKMDIGLMAYSENSSQSLPNKFFDYIGMGLPILNNLKGEVNSIIKKNKIGWNYNNIFQLKKILEQLINDRKQVFNFSKNVKTKFETKYDINQISKNLVKFIINNEKKI